MTTAPDEVDPTSTDAWKLEDPEEEPLNKIILRNVGDLTVPGLRRLCSKYGTVVDAFKTNTPGIAFVEFSNESEAALAVKQLNMKLGYNYNVDIATPKETLPTVVPVTQNGEPVSRAPLTDEDWEKVSLKRRFNVGFSLPLLINFPVQELLATSVNYRALDGCLRRTDPELFFRIYKVEDLFETPKIMDYDPAELQERVDALQKSHPNEKNKLYGDCFSYQGLSEKEHARFDYSYCVVCKGYGFNYCKGCRTYYCSVQHQKQHYEEHKLLCPTAAGAAASADDTLSEIKCETAVPKQAPPVNILTRDPLPGTKVKVFITAIPTPDRIYVRLAEPAANEQYLKTIGEFARAGLNAVPVVNSKVPVPGDIYLALYEPLNVYGRVLVAEVGPDKSKCVFIDHGMVTFVDNRALLLIDDIRLAYRKVQVYKVCLTDITDEPGEREKAVQYLTKLKDRPLQMSYRFHVNNIVDVQLQTPEGASVNEKINRLIKIMPIRLETSPGRNVRSNAFVMYKDLTQAEPTVGDNKCIMILNRTTILLDSRITWIAVDDLPYLKNLQAMLECYGRKVADLKESYLPREGEMCLVQCLNRWYRGVCYETAGDGKPAIFLCDYGSMTLVDLANVRKLPIQLATKVIRTHDGIVEHLRDAKANGLVLDAMFLDIYLPENEPVKVDIRQHTVMKGLPGVEEKETNTLLNLHELGIFLKSRQTNL
ncbi:protein vreteno [Anopheles maculipalpis]|uniref:protein vreteno n=1 Tax=Anopheles maculipalpis TaxID=1496333 RepID=UPI0021590637|nr:protein vreteno [Anopheles maculipalpis]